MGRAAAAPAVLRFAELSEEPWANGGGVTRVAASAIGAGPKGFDWRVSIADIDRDGPFSAFCGVDRVLTVVDGAVVLTIDGTEHVVRPDHPFAFPGDRATGCRLLLGPTRVVNVMTRRGRCRATVEIRSVPAAVDPPAQSGATVVLALSDRVQVDGDSALVALGRLDGVVSRAAPLHLAGHGSVLVAGFRSLR